MADINSLNNAYTNLATMYGPMMGINTKYDTHKKSELRGVYNSIVEKNKESPVFLLDTSKETKNFAVSLKESARNLKNTISSVSNEAEEEELLSKKTVSVSDPDSVEVSYIGEKISDNTITNFNLVITQLAQSQKNTGRFMPDEKANLPPDTYSFDVHSKDTDYEFQFNIGENDTNRSIQEKLARLINRSNIGIKASAVSDGNGNTALELESDDTGLRNGEAQFIVTDDHTSKTSGAVNYFGLDNIARPPTNAEFSINGIEGVSASNHFTIEDTYDLTLKKASEEGKSVSIGLKTDVESITDNIRHLIGGYNSFVSHASEYLESQPNSKALLREMRAISLRYGESLGKIGINFQDDGTISLDKDTIQKTAQKDDANESFNTIKSFATSVLNKANEVSLDPMQYTMRKVVEYKNPGHSFASPYVTSSYSGMMFSGYC
ncbi:MAG: flagellar filament capping protein FliD [Lachnospiraceae bacterium]|nr:flagellar filament capping protein FliD [Lachnospiraceae bacterium]MBQ7260402.1 flagellar filament capping protein FliD [Lachnospiraceae bacterium]